MNKWVITLITLFLTLSSWGAPRKLEIDSKLFFHGRKVASPRIVTNSGEKAKVIMSDQKNNREYNLEVYPQSTPGKPVKLLYSLAVKEANNETFTRGEVKVGENKNARISIDHGRIQIHLKVKES